MDRPFYVFEIIVSEKNYMPFIHFVDFLDYAGCILQLSAPTLQFMLFHFTIKSLP